MSEYNDKNTGQASGTKHGEKRNFLEEMETFKWPAVIILASIGLWPIAIALLVLFSQNRKQQNAARRRAAQARQAFYQAQNMQEGRRTAVQEAMDRRRGQTVNEAQPVHPKKTSKAQAEHPALARDRKNSKLLRIFGICTLVIGAIQTLDAIPFLIAGNMALLGQLSAGAGFITGGGIMWGSGEYLAKLSNRTRRYILAIGTAETMAIEEIAKRVNRTPDKTAKELQKLIDKGYLGDDAYIDYERGCFARFGAIKEERIEEPAEVPKEAEEGYSGILRELRTANDRIADAQLSAKIERLEQISALIFKEVEAHPEKRDRIRTFFDYYLPTTQKLLDTYAEFDEMGVEGENLRETKVRIEAMMDSIVEGFEHQLDQLYSTDAMDVVSDIKVMETMLNRDISSVAKDFGYDQIKQQEKDTSGMQQMEM